jgi:hypothetical protein
LSAPALIACASNHQIHVGLESDNLKPFYLHLKHQNWRNEAHDAGEEMDDASLRKAPSFESAFLISLAPHTHPTKIEMKKRRSG